MRQQDSNLMAELSAALNTEGLSGDIKSLLNKVSDSMRALSMDNNILSAEVFKLNDRLVKTVNRCEQLENEFHVANAKLETARKDFRREQTILEATLDDIGKSEQDNEAKELALKILKIYADANRAKLKTMGG